MASSTGPPSLGQALIADSEHRLIEEFYPRLQKCLSLLTEEEIWARPNEQTVSVGNLVLHLCGNVRQHIGFGLGALPDIRERAKEFSEKGPLPTTEVLELLERTMNMVRLVLENLDPDSLLEKRMIQGSEVSGLGTLLHVVEHFSYHVGQIGYSVKSRKNVDLGYYAGEDLDRTG